MCSFALPHKLQLLGLPAGQCIKVKVANTKGIELEQAFNPVSTDETPGEVVLLVKVRRRQPLQPFKISPSALVIALTRAMHTRYERSSSLPRDLQIMCTIVQRA